MDQELELSFFQRRHINKHMRRCSTSPVVRAIRMKSTMRCPFTPIRMAPIKNKANK
jgi:hypothetical protein